MKHPLADPRPAMTSDERLAALSARLRKPLPRGVQFNIAVWRDERGCGTAACAVGVAMGMREFRALGLKSQDAGGTGKVPIYAGYEGIDAAAMFFGLTEASAERLFVPECYRNGPATQAREVADRIDKLLASRAKQRARRAQAQEAAR
jgi:hypothetical protein